VRRVPKLAYVTLALLVAALLGLSMYLRTAPTLRAKLLRKAPPAVAQWLEPWLLVPAEAADAELSVQLTPVLRGLVRPVELVFVPGSDEALWVLEQPGRVVYADLRAGTFQKWLEIEVEDGTEEEGLLGMALHPKFSQNGRFFLNMTRSSKGERYSVVEEWRVPRADKPLESAPVRVREVLRVEQPFVNHNGGCLRFGPDGMLYIGFGDGGAAGDPHNNGQNPKTWLGAMLRIDVDSQEEGRAYAIPEDNPFRGRDDAAPEVFAIGLRNPWRYTFAPDGRLVVADVGQGDWEEIGYALAGDNLGWNRMEGRVCYRAEQCDKRGLRLPFHVYGHDVGQSITGGEVVLAEGSLKGKYVFGDYVSGRLWALSLPQDPHAVVEARLLGQWPVNPSTFGRDASGRVYLADHLRGILFRIDPRAR
jgi:glucose/arabinose dehydrogenase